VTINKNRLLPPGKDNPRNSEGVFLKLGGTRVMFAYTHYYAGRGGDHDNAYIAARYSEDNGKTWTPEDVIILQNEGQCNIMSISFLKLQNGDVLIGYLLKNSTSDCKYCIRRSKDNGKTWGDRIEVTRETKYHVVNNDRMIQLSMGRIIVPVAIHSDAGSGEYNSRGRVAVWFSDDNGYTWQQSNTVLESPVAADTEIVVPGDLTVKHKSGFQEPGIVELKDGRVMMWIRTDLGMQYISYSKDKGETWSSVEKSGLLSPCSPATIKRIPSTGDLVVVYNDHSGRIPFVPLKRTPLVSAISKDDGITWEKHKVLEDNPDGWYCYIAMEFAGADMLLAYCAGDKTVGKLSLTQITRVPVTELY